MGPNNIALVRLFAAEQALREAQGRLEAATRDVRIQERKVNDLSEKHALAQSKLRESQARAGTLDVDLKARDAHIEKLRQQQQLAKNNREYQALLVEINTAKVDRNKVEDEAIKLLEQVERLGKEQHDLSAHLETEKNKLQQMRAQINDRITSLQQQIDALRPARDKAAAAVPSKMREVFERIAERYDGEAMSAIDKPDRRREEYVCTACNMELVTDVYNKLHSRDELVFCPSCRRILYIPQDLPLEHAVNKPKERKERPRKAPPAAVGRQTSAVDVMRSIEPESEIEPENFEQDAPPQDVPDPANP